MTIIDPTQLNPNIPFGRFPSVQPFSDRTASGYQETLEEIRFYLQRKLYPYTAEMAQLYAELQAIVTATMNAPQPSPFGFYVLKGLGIDETGEAFSTAGVQAFLNGVPEGASVLVPSEAIIKLDAGLTVSKRMHLHGGGELRWTAGIAGTPTADQAMIRVSVPGCRFDGLYLTNPGHLLSNTGGKTVGVAIDASNTRISECTIVGQSNAVVVGADGDYHDIIISYNHILDVPGGGAEDRGDGISFDAASGVIIGNVVAALESTTNDPRIGISVEGLSVYETTPYVYADSSVIVANNVVNGPFRRSITAEGVASCVLVGNAVSGSTVWGMNVVNTAGHTVVADNTITMRVADGDPRGNDLAPNRCGIMVYDNVVNADIHDNTVRIIGTGRVHGIVVQQGTALSSDVHVHHNTLDGMGGVKMGYGIFVPNGATRLRANDNIIRNFALVGIYAVAVTDVEFCRNKITGSGSTTKGMHVEGAGEDGRFDGNTLDLVGQSMELYFRSGFTTVKDNRVKGASTGIDLYGMLTGGKLMLTGNLVDATTQFSNVPANGNGFQVLNANNL